MRDKGLTYREIGKECGVGQNSIRLALARAKIIGIWDGKIKGVNMNRDGDM